MKKIMQSDEVLSDYFWQYLVRQAQYLAIIPLIGTRLTTTIFFAIFSFISSSYIFIICAAIL